MLNFKNVKKNENYNDDVIAYRLYSVIFCNYCIVKFKHFVLKDLLHCICWFCSCLLTNFKKWAWEYNLSVRIIMQSQNRSAKCIQKNKNAYKETYTLRNRLSLMLLISNSLFKLIFLMIEITFLWNFTILLLFPCLIYVYVDACVMYLLWTILFWVG